MKKLRLFLAAVLTALLLSGCCLSHDWAPATCTAPETCSKCGKTQGEALGHSWAEADCVTPKTCSVCGETEGEALGHTWVEADCLTPKTCSVCGETEGDALGHTWVEADCLTPKTCSVCGETEGEALGHTWVEADCVNPKTCSVCGETEGEALGHTWMDADCVTPKTCSVCGETEGEALGHTWVEADCVTPKTCSVCGETEGDPLGHDAEEATCTEDSVCRRCGMLLEAALGHDADEATANHASVCRRCGEVLAEALGYEVTNQSDGFGFINRQGKLVIDLVYDKAYPFSDGLARVYEGASDSYGVPDGGLYGYINEAGETVIPIKYSTAGDFHDGVAVVRENGKLEIIDTQGNVLPQFSGYDYLSYYPSSKLVLTYRGELTRGLPAQGTYTIFTLDGSEVFSGEYERLYVYGDYMKAKRDGKYAVVGLDGKEKTGFVYDYLGSSAEGLISYEIDGKYGAVTIDGKTQISRQYDSLGAFCDGKAIAEKDGVYCLIDTKNAVLATYSADYMDTQIVDGRVMAFEGTLSQYGLPEDGSYFLMNLEGSPIAEGFEDYYSINEETKCVRVKKDGRWGAIDLNGETVFPFVECDRLLSCGDLYCMESNGSYTLVNANNEPVTDVTWEDVYATSEALIPVAKHPVKDFRSARWGMSEEEVRQLEPGEPVLADKLQNRNGNYIAYEGSLMGNDVLIVYYFGPNGLYEGRYIWTEEHSNESLYISDYEDVREQITNKYGEPLFDEELWDTNDHKSYYANKKGDALCYGYLTYYTIYTTDRTEITMIMDADNYDISFLIYYESKTISAPKADYSGDF